MDPELIGLLEKLKEARLGRDAAEEDAQEYQRLALPLLAKSDPEGEGVALEAWGKRYRAKVQQNKTPESWDLEKLVPWLVENGHWEYVCTQILDQAKLEAEIRAGNISRRDLRKFVMKGTKPKAYIRVDPAAPRVIRRRRKK